VAAFELEYHGIVATIRQSSSARNDDADLPRRRRGLAAPRGSHDVLFGELMLWDG